jgi:hypothetical protein
MSNPSRDFVGEAVSGAAVFNDFEESDPRADVPPAESMEEFEINSE